MQQKQRRKGKRSGKNGGPQRRNEKKLLALVGDAPDTGSFKVGRNLIHNYLKPPSRPMPGARLTTRQLTKTFSNSTGFTGSSIVIASGATSTLGALSFTLSDLAQVSSFSALFDQYRFERVRLHVKSRNNAVFVANTASPNAAVPQLLLVIDRDDVTAPSAYTDLLQYDNVVSISGEEDAIVDLIPSITPAVFASGAFSGYASMPSNSMWIDIANTTVPVYGIKFATDLLTLSTTSSWVWDLTAEVVVSFKNTR